MPFLLAPHPIVGWSSCLGDESRVFQHRHTVYSGLPLSYTAYCIWRKGERNKQKRSVVARGTHASNDRHCDTIKAIDQRGADRWRGDVKDSGEGDKRKRVCMCVTEMERFTVRDRSRLKARDRDR